MTRTVHARMMDSMVSVQTTDSRNFYSTEDQDMDYKAKYIDAMQLLCDAKKMIEARDAELATARRNRGTTDTLLTPPTAAEWAAYARSTARIDLGKFWDGTWKPLLDAMAPDARKHLFKQMDEYRSKQTTDSARSHDPLGRWHTAKLNSDLNAAARKRWNLPPVA